MPDYYASIHEGFMNRFFEEGKGKVMNNSRVVFGKNRDGYLIRLLLRLSIIPALKKGVELVGLIQFNTQVNEKLAAANKEKNQKENQSNVDAMLVNLDSGDIISATANCYRRYGLKSNLFNQKTLKRPNLSLIAPDLLKKTV